MSYLTINGIRRTPNYTGEWLLTDTQVDVLTQHQTFITNELFKLLNSNYCFAPTEHSSWIMLGQHLIELLHVSDGTAFRSTCSAMINSMAKVAPLDNPFVIASIAETNMIPTENFTEVLKPFLKQNTFGLLPFATGFLNLGDHFSTLWALRMIGLMNLQDKYADIVEKAITALEGSTKDLDKPDFVGFFLFVLILLNRDKDKALIQQFTEFLIKNKEWKVVDHNLRSGGFVAYDLLYGIEHHPNAMPIVENWLIDAFSLNEEKPNGLPQAFKDAQIKDGTKIPTDVWAQGYIRTLIASGLYLKMRRLEYTPASDILANGVLVHNAYKELANFHHTVSPHLDSYHRLYDIKKDLTAFWDNDESKFTKSVFVSRWMGKGGSNGFVNPVATKIINAIKEELNSTGLICRYSGDIETNYSDNLYENNEIYMRGCKNCIAVFEGMPGNDKAPCTTNHNVLIETGFMRGKGAEVLLLHDPNKASEPPSDWSGILYKEFNQEDENLIQLRVAVRAWAEKIVNALEKQNKEEAEVTS